MRFVKYHLPVIICAVGIFIASSITVPSDTISFFPHSDKVFHILIYSLLAFLNLRALCASKPDKSVLSLKITAFTAAFSYGIMIEVYQYFLPARTMEILDVLSNGMGALLGILFFQKHENLK